MKAFKKLYDNNLKVGGFIQPQYDFAGDAEESDLFVNWNGYKATRKIINKTRWTEMTYMIQKANEMECVM